MIEPYFSRSTGYIIDSVDSEGDGEQVSYCIVQDGDDVLIGRHWIEDGQLKEEKWLVSMKARTFEKLLANWQAN